MPRPGRHGAKGSTTETSPLLSDRPRDSYTDDNHGATSSPTPKSDEPKANMRLLLPAVGAGMFMVALDQLLVVTSYAKIGNDLKALKNTSWIATSYFLTLTIFQPLYGRLSDIFGRKECLLFAYAVFGLGCLGCGLSQDIVQLCIWRAVSGIGGGGVNAVVSILLSDLVPLRERGVYQGYINVIWGTGTSLGAPLGGFLADTIGWRWSFICQAPLSLVVLLMVCFLIRLPKTSHAHWLTKLGRIDVLGAATLALAVVTLLVGLDAGSNLGWSHRAPLVALSLSPVFFALFVLVETRVAKYPFAPGHIIFSPALFACYLTNFFGMAGQMATFFLSPLYFQAVEGRTAAESGTLMMPATLAIVASSVGGGWIIKRYGRLYWPTVLSFALELSSVVPFALSVWLGSTVGLCVGLVLAALGIGCGITTTLIGLLANAAPEDSAVAIACSYLFRSLGSSMGVGISSAVQQQLIRSQLEARLGGGGGGGGDGNGNGSEIAERVRESLDYINELPRDVADLVRSVYRLGTLGAVVPTTLLLTAAFLASFWVKEKVLEK
ncbi:Vacuolar membrane amino acid uptake transporter fnx2 [Colletotrichum sidae]|uniref:Vacuolar membrane amino acid uptake transporter fnx2 n=1 Tax=Colletotrichum sidae TaxID=1347389 RepID=A0A4R8T2M5_9PEZI|nr:Vacuolar membrane amino acid uptake transporter fnx2 [Colletotrichum sidae]